jgi:NADH oxidase (H2O-forming)
MKGEIMATEPVQLAEGVYWVGAFNPGLRIFDIIMRTEQGTTYNAYLVRGRDKTALIETVKSGHFDQLAARVEKIMPFDQIDYLVCNHLEPDHSGSLLEAKARAPKAQVIVSKNGAAFLKELFNQDLRPLAVGTGDRIDLGGKTLEFITAPFLHWPDTMFTYLPENRTLFSCDFLACHYCHEGVLSDQVGDFSFAYEHYFNAILRPFKDYVLKGLEAIRDKAIDLVGTSHGPVLNHDLPKFIERYRTWASAPERVPGGRIGVFYVSAYGMTGRLAEAIAEGARQAGAASTLFDLVGTDIPEIVSWIEAADAVAVGSCTLNGDAVKPAWDLLSSLDTIRVKGKWAAVFGSYGWSGEAVPMLEERLKGLKFHLVQPGLRVKFAPTVEDVEAARALGRTLAEKIRTSAERGSNK